MNEFTKPVEKISKDTAEYVDLRIKDLKLRVVKGLSVSLNELLAMILILFVLSGFMFSLAAGLILVIGKLIGNYAIGAFAVAILFAIGVVILFKKKGRLFVNTMVKTFSGLFFDDDEGSDEAGSIDLSTFENHE